MDKIVLLIICNLFIVSAEDVMIKVNETKLRQETTTTASPDYYDDTTTEEPDDTTTLGLDVLPDIVWRDAVNIDYGEYQSSARYLMYFNEQNHKTMRRDRLDNADRCYEDQIRCIINQSYGSPVCGIHYSYPPSSGAWHKWEDFGNVFPTLCDLFFENCRRRERYWRVLNFGYCLPFKSDWGGGNADIGIPGYGNPLGDRG